MSTSSIPIISSTTPPVAVDTLSVDHIRTIFDPKTCIQRGLCTVAKTKERAPKPHNLYYELHGSQDKSATKLVFIMGKS